MCRRQVVGLAAVAIAVFASAELRAQDALLAELYGQGVHSYFAGEYENAHQMLTTAIEQGSADPRCYYFRGLAYSRLGRPDEANADFKRGAELEAGANSRVYPVGNSLQRIQGQDRLALERFRQTARLTIYTRNMKATQARYEQLERAEENVLRNPAQATAAPAAGEALPAPAAGADDATDPFASGAPKVAPEPAGEKPAATPAAPDPFSSPATPAPAADPATEPAPTPDASDPFGANPFGGTPAGTPENKPANDANNDPFADDPF